MRVPSFERFQRISAAASFFVCGLVVGAAVYGGLENDQFDKVLRRNIELRQQLDESQAKLNQAEQFRNKHTVIKSILPFIEVQQGKPAVDILTEAELKKRLKSDLSIFLGRSIYKIGSDAQLARRLLERKIYDGIGDKDYVITVKTLLVVEGELHVWVEAKVHLRL